MNWNFRQGGKTENPKDAGIKEFSKHIFESVVREATQNAIDKRWDYKKPVIVEFTFGKIDSSNIPGFSELVDRWRACYDKWKDQMQYEIFLREILDRIDSFNGVVPFLSISDYNTEGMDFTSNSDIDKTSYGAFSRGNHSFHNSDHAAGSEGQGKAALFAISSMRTMFVHSVSKMGSIYEGLTRFATHTFNGEKFNSDGYFPYNPEMPEYEKQPNLNWPFRRKKNELGTAITLIGLWNFEDVERNMLKAAINNFWMAIAEGDLILRIEKIELNRSNIHQILEEYLPERSESSKTKSDPTAYGKARCYYETWTQYFQNVTEVYEENLEVIGKCKLVLSQHPEYPGKIAFFREQKMLILRSSVNLFIPKGYCGVFMCDDRYGNTILRSMEGKTHTEWDPTYPITQEDKKKAKKAHNEIVNFIKRSWLKYRSKHFPDDVELKGLSRLSEGFNSKSGKKISESKKNAPQKKVTEPKPNPEFEKNGVIRQFLFSSRENNRWKYKLTLRSDEYKRVKIDMLPATDSSRVSRRELIDIIEVTQGWSVDKNSISGILEEGQNTIEFILDENERVGLRFNLTIE